MSSLEQGRSLWAGAWRKLKSDRLVVASGVAFVIYALVALGVGTGWVASDWGTAVGASYQPPSLESWRHWLGTDIFGRSVITKVIYGTQIAMGVGFVSALISIPIGASLGAIAGYFGGWIDEAVVWFYTTLSAIPTILLLVSITWVMGKGLAAIYIAIGVTSWVGLARMIRGEFIKHKERDYVMAADALGASHMSRIFRHILPNVFHFVIIFFSMLFVSAIKAEVILSFLGLGVQGMPSWGIMIDDAKNELSRGVWWQLAGASGAMFFIVLALNILGDALRDALDPKVR
jgi:ABC-type dipeptide/oligopeptide/nickel transport system permease subunit